MPTMSPTSPSSPPKGPATLHVVSVLIGLVVGGLIGAAVVWQVAKDQGKTEGIAEANKRLADAGTFSTDDSAEEELHDISGSVESVNGNVIVVNADQTQRNPLSKQAPIVRRVRVTDTTTLTLRTERSEAEYRTEQAAYDAAVEAARAKGNEDPEITIERPSRYSTKTVKIGDVKPGMEIMASAATDIRFAEAFNASAVTVTVDIDEPADEETDATPTEPNPEP